MAIISEMVDRIAKISIILAQRVYLNYIEVKSTINMAIISETVGRRAKISLIWALRVYVDYMQVKSAV